MNEFCSPKLTIVIPSYNAEGTILRLLDSIGVSHAIGFQTIIVDDVSTDKTVQVVKTHYKKAIDTGALKLKRLTQNSGPSIARQVGLDMVTTDYVTFADADDYYTENAIPIIMDYLGNDCDYLFFKYITNHRGGIKLKKDFKFPLCANVKDVYINKVNGQNPIWHYVWNKVYRTSIIRANAVMFAPELKSAEDVKFNDDYLPCVSKVTFIDKFLYVYDCSNASLTRTKHRKQPTIQDCYVIFDNELARFKKLLHDVENKDCLDECLQQLRKGLCKVLVKLSSRYATFEEYPIFEKYVKQTLSDDYHNIMRYKSTIKLQLRKDKVILKIKSIIKQLIR